MNALDIRTIVFARHAQHVVLVHFPIAAFMTAVGLDCAAQWTKKPGMAAAAYFAFGSCSNSPSARSKKRVLARALANVSAGECA